jgi:hypothetical protein
VTVDEQALIEEYKAGDTLTMVSNHHHVHMDRARRILQDAGVEIRPRGKKLLVGADVPR